MNSHERSENQAGHLLDELERFRKLFGEMMETMAEAEDGSLRGLFTRFIAQLEHYFELEDRVIESTDAPEARTHKEEHRQMLNELYYFKERIENGLFSLGRTYVNVRLPEWFREHAETHDQGLNDHLLKEGVRSAA